MIVYMTHPAEGPTWTHNSYNRELTTVDKFTHNSGQMAEIIKPSVQAFLVCDNVIADAATGKKTIVGAFTTVRATSFPCVLNQLALYFCLTDGEGKYQFVIELVYLNENKTIGRAPLNEVLEFKDRLEIVDAGVTLPPTMFPGPGRYEFRLLADEHFIASKDFNAILQTV